MTYGLLAAALLSLAAAWNSAATLDNFYTFQDVWVRVFSGLR